MTTAAEPGDGLDVRSTGGLATRMGVPNATARRYIRQSVTLPDGREINGWPPGMAGGRLEEHRLRDNLAAQVHGITEACLPYGRADVLTATAVYEVETARKWRDGVRQVLAYSLQTGLPPAVALFGTIHRDDLLKLYIKLRGDQWWRNSMGTIALWWWGGAAWEHICSRSRCRNMPVGARPVRTGRTP
jgi:hypothetical protein